MKYAFYFKVELYIDDTYYTNSGLGFAKDFAEAANQLEECFQDDLIAITHLEFTSDTDLIFLPDDLCRRYIKTEDSFLKNLVEEEE